MLRTWFRAMMVLLLCRPHLRALAAHTPLPRKLPHYEGDACKGYKLVDPDGNLKEKLCEKLQKCLKMFCKSDDTCICMMCGMTEYNSYEKDELETETEGKQKQVGTTQSEIRRRLKEKEKKLMEMRRTAEEMKDSRELEAILVRLGGRHETVQDEIHSVIHGQSSELSALIKLSGGSLCSDHLCLKHLRTL
ncbi:TRI47 protein, partial [Polypterus senegalus]